MPNAANAVSWGGGNARWATPPSRFAAVMDCPSGPSTIHSVGTIAAGPTEYQVTQQAVAAGQGVS